MKLFKLEITEWAYDCVKSCVCLAEDAESARRYIFSYYEKERLNFENLNIIHPHSREYNSKWLNENESTCLEIDMSLPGMVHDYVVNG